MKVTKAAESFLKKGYRVSVYDTKEEAVRALCEELCAEKIGFGGSETLRELGLYEALSEKNEVLWHWRCPEGVEPSEMRRRAAECDCYFCSANALSEAGEIVNIDGTANRVAATLYGCKKVYFICGENKIEPDLSAAIFRARNVAAPINTRRLGLNTPCAKTGKCHDCNSPERICRALTVLWEKPTGAEMHVVLVRERLGY